MPFLDSLLSARQPSPSQRREREWKQVRGADSLDKISKFQNAQQLVSFLCRLWIFCGVTLKPRKVAAPTPSEVEAVTLAQTSPRNCCCNTDCSCSSDPTSANRRDTSSVTVDRWTSGCAYCPNLDFKEVDDHMWRLFHRWSHFSLHLTIMRREATVAPTSNWAEN